MTVAVCVKVGDGQVLAADSAATIPSGDPDSVANIYDHANKIVNLRKGLPLGVMFWGAGGIGGISMEMLAKDLRLRFAGADPDYRDWRIDPANYQLADVAQRTFDFFIGEHYTAAYDGWEPAEIPMLGCAVAGYSSANVRAECCEIGVSESGSPYGPKLVQNHDAVGVFWKGEREPITRLIKGVGVALQDVLREDLGVPSEQAYPAAAVIADNLEVSLVHPAMPIQDAIDLADFLVDVAKRWARFIPAAPTVGGPTEIAAITKHEGFRWVRRKHYYPPELNPSIDDPQTLVLQQGKEAT